MAVSAISALIARARWKEQPSILPDHILLPNDDHHHTALTLYGKAMSKFAGYAPSDRPSLATALTTCVLFICVEMLEDNIGRGTTLLRVGFNLLAEFNQELHRSSSTAEVTVSIKTAIEQILTRISVAAAFSNIAVSPPSVPRDTTPNTGVSCFNDLAEACSALYALMAEHYQLLKFGEEHKNMENLHVEVPEILLEQQKLGLLKLHQWHAAFKDMFAKTIDVSIDKRTVSTLFCHYYTSIIWISTACTPYETPLDHYDNLFRDIVQHARIVVACGANADDSTPPAFKFDIGLIPVLFFVSKHCRHPEIRRQAVQLLSKCPLKEGVWEAWSIARIAERIVDIEEKAGVMTLAPDWQVSPTSVPPAHHLDRVLSPKTLAEESKRVHSFRLYKCHSLEWHIGYTTFACDNNGNWHAPFHDCALEARHYLAVCSRD